MKYLLSPFFFSFLRVNKKRKATPEDIEFCVSSESQTKGLKEMEPQLKAYAKIKNQTSTL